LSTTDLSDYPSFLFCADLHLRPRPWSSPERATLSGDAYVSLDAIAAIAIAERLNVVLGGDIFDSKYPPVDADR
jgi:DNA repair exonuclease SbcCD nuclease subunit